MADAGLNQQEKKSVGSDSWKRVVRFLKTRLKAEAEMCEGGSIKWVSGWEEAEEKGNLSPTYTACPPSVTPMETIKLQEIIREWNSQISLPIWQWSTLPGIPTKSPP